MNNTRSLRGFTLVEMLVVIGIVAVLAAILTSGFLYGLRSARISECASNLHNMEEAIRMYKSDSDGTFPLYALGQDRFYLGSHNGEPANIKDWANHEDDMFLAVMRPYGVSSTLLRCPLDTLYGTDAQIFTIGTHRQSSYFSSWVGYEMDWLTLNDAQIPSASGFCILEDGFLPLHDPIYFPNDPETGHGDDANAVFDDGHVKSIYSGSPSGCNSMAQVVKKKR